MTVVSQSKSLRLFVAVYPPPDVAIALLETLAKLDLPPHRVVPPEQVHLTLQFIGDTPPGKLDEIGETVQRAAGGLGVFEMRFVGLMTLPQGRRARLMSAEADRPAPLIELHRRLATRLAQRPRRDAADRFRPHFTLCRFRAPQRIDRIERSANIDPFTVREVVLLRSTLRPQGAEHHALSTFLL